MYFVPRFLFLAAMNPRLEAAITAVDPLDGAVRVVVGGRDYLESSFNRSTQVMI